MAEQDTAPPENIEDKLAAFDFDAPKEPAGTPEPQAAGDEQVEAAPEGEVETQPVEDDIEVNLRDNRKVKLSELKRGYRPDWENWDKSVREFANRQQAFQQATAGFTQAQQQAAHWLQQAVSFVENRLPKAPEQSLLDTDPFEYQKQKANYDNEIAKLDQLKAMQAAQIQQIQRQQYNAFQQRRARELEATLQAFPDLRDKEKLAKFEKEVMALGSELGFTPAEMGQIHDHRLVKLIDLALQAKRQKAAAEAAKAKLKAAQQPPVQAPSRRRTPSEVQADTLRARMDKLRKNPNSARAAEDVLSQFD